MDEKDLNGYSPGMDWTAYEQEELDRESVCPKCGTFYHTWHDEKICECNREEEISWKL